MNRPGVPLFNRSCEVSVMQPTFADTLLVQYLHCRRDAVRDLAGLERVVSWWRERLRGVPVVDIDVDRVVAARRALLANETGRPRSPATVNRYLTTLLAAVNLWRFGADRRPCPPPIPRRSLMLREPPPRVRYLEPREAQGLVHEAARGPGFLLPLVCLALLTGLRRGELLALRWADIDGGRRAIRVCDSKNGTARWVYLGVVACDVLQAHYEVAVDVDGLIFPHAGGLSRAFSRACVRAGIADFRFHDLRHTTASWLAMEGRSLLEIAEVLGHKTLAMTRRYAHLAPSHLPAVMDTIADKYMKP